MNIGDEVTMPFTGMEFTYTERMDTLEKATTDVLHKLNPNVDSDAISLEARMSSELSCEYGDLKYLPYIEALSDSVSESLRWFKSRPSTAIQSVNSAWCIMTRDRVLPFANCYRGDDLSYLQKLLGDSNSTLFEEYPVLGAAYMHVVCSLLKPYVDGNDLMSRALVYLMLGKYYPTIWSCSLSYVINCGNNTAYRSTFSTPITFAIECMMKLIYESACFAYVQQSLGENAFKVSLDDLVKFLYRNSNIGKIEDFIEVVRKEVLQCL